MEGILSGVNGQSVLQPVEEAFAIILELAPTPSQKIMERRVLSRILDRLKNLKHATHRTVVSYWYNNINFIL